MIRSTFLQLVSILFAAVCLVSSASAAGPDKDPLNWRVRGSGTTIPTSQTEASDQISGRSSFLGRFTGSGTHELYATGEFDGQFVYRAANGDQLWVSYAGALTSYQSPYAFEATVSVIGGTGRFDDATGGGTMTGTFTGVPGNVEYTLIGTLNP